MPLEITPATNSGQVESVRALFVEYAQSLGFSLCFQGFDEEIATLPGAYAPPQGRLLLATIAGVPAGCVAIRPLEGDACELKRLFVRPAHRATGLGRALMDRILAEAPVAGYRRMRLDTVVGTMDRAIAMYRRYGFKEIQPYGKHPVPGTIDMELEL
ncbi:MAG TPA: GNAT family N-acetyltransferase [Gemmatimonadales bacterium]|jgi:GNAT superfamily N-acetyltransferase|nr:GNAT family N-acetyltransferase [Gemmatimonadales bacterium]